MEKAVSASPEDFATEFLDYIMSVKVVDSLDEAIKWINTYTTSHSEAIVTQDISRAEQFQDDVDAAAVYVNASTRSQTASSLDWVLKSESQPRKCMLVAQWDWRP